MKVDKQEFSDSLARLHGLLAPGSVVTCVLRSVARSGLSRHIDLYRISGDTPFWLSGHASKVLGIRQAQDGSLVVSGGGMDVGFATVYDLAGVMWPNGYQCPGDNCPSNSHINPGPQRTDYSGNVWHKDSYALKHSWL